MDSKELEKLVEGISKLINWYSTANSDNGDFLASAKRKLLGYSFTFSTAVGYALDSYNKAYAHRKSETAKKVLEYVSNGDAQFKASMKAEIDVKDMRLVESGYESLYRRLKGQQEAINNTIASIMQDLKRLENEFKQTGN
jgi:hypothetical protein